MLDSYMRKQMFHQVRISRELLYKDVSLLCGISSNILQLHDMK